MALCHYNLRQYAAALKYITEIIERGIKEHPGQLCCLASLSLSLSLSLPLFLSLSLSPSLSLTLTYLHFVELSVGMQTEGVDIRSVGNTAVSYYWNEVSQN